MTGETEVSTIKDVGKGAGEDTQHGRRDLPTGPVWPARLQDRSQQKPESFKHAKNKQTAQCFEMLKRTKSKKVPQNFTLLA